MSFINPNNRLKMYVENQVEEEDNLEDYKIYIYFSEDNYAKYDVEQVTGKAVIRTKNELYRLPPLGLFKRHETVKVNYIGYLNKDLLLKIVDYSEKGRTFIIEVKKEEDFKLIAKLVNNFEDNTAIKLFDLKDYEDELEWCKSKILEWKSDISNNLLYKLMYYMKKNHDKWNDMELMFSIEDKIDDEILDDYFEGLESYNIDDWVDSVVMGNRKGKNIVILDYLISIKEYEPYLIVDIIKERLELYLELIGLYDRGVMYGRETTENEILERSEYLKLKVSDKLLSDKREKLITNLGIIKQSEIKYAYEHLIKLMTSKNKYTINTTDIVYLIDLFRVSKSEERVKEINKKNFQAFQRNKNKNKSKKK